jgi:N-acyl-phosphatidylethanolamine-hydrolysing phospholipase D
VSVAGSPAGLGSRRDDSGRFEHPWPLDAQGGRGLADLLRWRVERARQKPEPNPPPGRLRVATPAFARPRAPADELRLTWVGHATFLLQLGGLNVLTDAMWSRRASPLPWLGPERLVPPGVPFDALPPIDVVILSHDHYDHLDDATVRAIVRRSGDSVQWISPLGYGSWLRRRGVRRHVELDWWQSTDVGSASGSIVVTATPAQHWTKRSPFSERERLWASFCLGTPGGTRVFFCGDSGYFAGLRTIGARLGPFAATLLPVGAYEPRWFMKLAHMNPEEAVRAYGDLGGAGVFVAMHWGTFRLTDEPPLEPPARVRAEWAARNLPPGDLWIPRHGETRLIAAQ